MPTFLFEDKCFIHVPKTCGCTITSLFNYNSTLFITSTYNRYCFRYGSICDIIRRC